jgi:rsbT co-antagonist protein RsbR
MERNGTSKLAEIVQHKSRELLTDWLALQCAADTARRDLLNDRELREQSQQFLRTLSDAMQQGSLTDMGGPAWAATRELLEHLSDARATQGFTATETATFVFSLKQPLFTRLRQAHGPDADGLADDVWQATVLLDKLGLYSTEMYQQRREALIIRQQEELLELSTPVIQLWDGVLALPLIGTLDSARTQLVMENLLQRIVDTGSAIAIIDITGVPLVDTLVAQHLLKTVAAARLMGAECLISGIRPQIAQTIVHLGVSLGDVTTKATLADALAVALSRLGQRLQPS